MVVDDEKTRFAARFNKACDIAGIQSGRGRRAELARMFGVSGESARKWLSGESIPKSSRIANIARSLGVNGEWLLTGQGEAQPPHLPSSAPDGAALAGGRHARDVVEPGPGLRARVPLVSWITAGNWGEVVDNFQPGDADDWIATTANVGPHAFALRIRGESMVPTIPDGAIVVVDPDAQPRHRSVVIVRQNHDSEATCKRLIQEGSRWFLQPDNPRYPVLEMSPDAKIVGVVRQVVVDLE
jgi:SOS-response transcriptional repressor LexA